GFDTVPYITIEPEEIPQSLEEFRPWLMGYLDEMLYLQGTIPSDGVVMEVDDLNYVAEVKNQYVSRNIALKLEHWSHKYYVGTVTDIIEEQQGVVCSYTTIIEPLVTSDKTTARRINSF